MRYTRTVDDVVEEIRRGRPEMPIEEVRKQAARFWDGYQGHYVRRAAAERAAASAAYLALSSVSSTPPVRPKAPSPSLATAAMTTTS